MLVDSHVGWLSVLGPVGVDLQQQALAWGSMKSGGLRGTSSDLGTARTEKHKFILHLKINHKNYHKD